MTIRGYQVLSRHFTGKVFFADLGFGANGVGIGSFLSYGSVMASLFQLLKRLVLPLIKMSTHKSYEFGLLVGLEDTYRTGYNWPSGGGMEDTSTFTRSPLEDEPPLLGPITATWPGFNPARNGLATRPSSPAAF